MTVPTDKQRERAQEIAMEIRSAWFLNGGGDPRDVIAQALAVQAAQTERETVEKCVLKIKVRAEQWKRSGKPPDGHTDETVMRRRAMTDAANELYADILALVPAPAGLV
ncbi:MAG: hypothetical protein AABZ67_00490 [Pseudomonadota bacterium]